MIFLILLGLTFFMQLLCASWYDLAKKTKDTKKAFKHKMLCSAIYTAAVLLCNGISKQPFGSYSVTFFICFVLLFLSDVFEEKLKSKGFVVSLYLKSFAFSGITGALLHKHVYLFSENFSENAVAYVTITAIAVLIFILATIIKKEPKRIPLAAASALLVTQGILFGIPLQQSPNAIHQAASCAIVMGTLAVTVSNILSITDKTEKKSLLKVNLYYFGLMFLACSVAIL